MGLTQSFRREKMPEGEVLETDGFREPEYICLRQRVGAAMGVGMPPAADADEAFVRACIGASGDVVDWKALHLNNPVTQKEILTQKQSWRYKFSDLRTFARPL